MEKIALAIAVMLAGSAALAADTTVQSAQRCAQVQDSLQRLVCYDRVFPPGDNAATPAATPAAPPAAAPAQEFGAESVRRSEEERQAEAPVRSLTATVKSVREMRADVFRMTLDNGQVWDQMEMDMTFHVQVGDTVQIERGRLGGYRMSRTTRGGSGWVRVNRLK
jgi:hypothetical protein